MDKFSTTDNEGDDGGGGSGTVGVDRSAASHAQNPFALRHTPSEDQTMQWKVADRLQTECIFQSKNSVLNFFMKFLQA